MRIARVFTVCAALISAFIDAESVHSRRRPESKDYLPQPKPDNAIDPNEVTFTTLQPEVKYPHKNMQLHFKSTKGYQQIRSSRSMPQRSRSMKANRRRRQLQHANSRMISELGANHIENQQIETIQGPAEAFDEGAVHIEPIYRVTKNKNIFDMIVNLLRRIVDPPKSLGPLVGPFHFPGVGDKVYIRLLEPDQPDNLVIRLISHLPAPEIESVLDKNIIKPSGVIEHAELLPEDHKLSAVFDQHTDVHLNSLDSSLSSSNNLVHVAKPGEKIAPAKTKDEPVWRTYKLHLKPDVLKQRKRNPPAYVPSGPKLAHQTNRTQNGVEYFQDFDQNYQFYLPMNESSTVNPELLNVNFHQFHANAPRFESFVGPQVRTLSKQEFVSKKNYNATSDNQPKYSIEYFSKDMRYLNLDGSVEPAVKRSSKEKFNTVETKAQVSNDRPWTPIKRVLVRRKFIRGSRNKTEHAQDRSDNEEVFEVLRTDNRTNFTQHSQNATENENPEERKGSRFSKEERKNTRISYDEHKTSINNSTSNAEFKSNSKSTSSPMVQSDKLQTRRNSTKTNV